MTISIVKNKDQADRLSNNLIDIGIALYGGGDVITLLSRCKNKERQGSALYKIYAGLQEVAMKTMHSKTSVREATKDKLYKVIALAIDHHVGK